MQNQPVTEELLKEMTEKIVREVKPRKVVLFGSHARGTARPDSDLDFLIIEDGPFNAQRSRRAEMTRLWMLFPEERVPIDFLVQKETPRLCRGTLKVLTVPGVI